MKTAFTIALISLLPASAVGQTYLCVPEKGAVVESNPTGQIDAGLLDIEPVKFLLTGEKGNRAVKMLGNDFALFDACVSDYFCERSDSWAGVFIRSENGLFSVVWLSKLDDVDQLVSAKGKCSTVD